jgi:hypothetical protein
MTIVVKCKVPEPKPYQQFQFVYATIMDFGDVVVDKSQSNVIFMEHVVIIGKDSFLATHISACRAICYNYSLFQRWYEDELFVPDSFLPLIKWCEKDMSLIKH